LLDFLIFSFLLYENNKKEIIANINIENIQEIIVILLNIFEYIGLICPINNEINHIITQTNITIFEKLNASILNFIIFKILFNIFFIFLELALELYIFF